MCERSQSPVSAFPSLDHGDPIGEHVRTFAIIQYRTPAAEVGVLFVGSSGEIYCVVAPPPEEPVKYEDLKKSALGLIEGDISSTQKQAEKDKEFEKLVDTIIDDGAYHRLRNENQRLFYLTHKYNLLRRDAKEIMDMLAAVRAMARK